MFKFGRKTPAPAPEPTPVIGWMPQPVECLSEPLRTLVERPVKPLPMGTPGMNGPAMGGNWNLEDLHPDDRRAVHAEDRAAGRFAW